MVIALALTGCMDYGETERESGTVNVDLALSVTGQPTGLVTRMADDVTQTSGNFRGIEDITVIPFQILTPQVTKDDSPLLSVVSESLIDPFMTKSNYLFFKGCTFSMGVNAFLFYGQAARQNTGNIMTDNNRYGALTADFNNMSTPSAYRFNLVQRWPDVTSIPEEAQQLADYLTNIANAEAEGLVWKETKNPLLQALFKNFVNKTEDETIPYEMMAGSAANAQAHVKNLQESLEGATSLTGGAANLKNAILDKIGTGVPSSISYPASVGLPDGAAVMQWNGTAFVPLTTTTTLADITPISRFTYPAELWYYANSHIKASFLEDITPHNPSQETWDKVLSAYYNMDNAEVSSYTKAIALKDPAQYAVARLEIKLKDTGSTLKDAADGTVSINPDEFPLTGIIVGGQYPVGYNFEPISDDETELSFIYDGQPTTASDTRLSLHAGTGTSSQSVSTLALQSNNLKDVPIVLEFLNNGSQTFKGMQDGVIRPGTKFYLMGTIKAPTYDPSKGDQSLRVLTQDYTTRVTISVESLAKAYNVLPDMLEARFELGVQVVTDWIQSTTSYIILHE